ncbi:MULTISPECIES: TonB-dependent receptor [Alteromonas]|jgi:iron complex outermembrane recepter protein|nr:MULTISPECIES: TonB-dependent receptor [Alteromonas]AGP93477.1 TonB-dependent receptor [Alteromonas mediterranea U8]MBR9897173.1 TonB-dependent receptor [Gammaproteobacteria bacterium]MEA3382305.1 TonB-dependent receptor [Pseudomonadota bacterium]AGP81735.1 TonB-dependent receptor [Alteromonas mediterranea MED64]AGP85481.1 TonB-dependent receptor [Alteromonas mediterranea U4]|tara:strand:+ start:6009 stop:8720 length:2712 start_codon:yes stop_codon:yes gene_type:complete
MRKTQLSCAIVAALASTSLAAQDTGAPAKLETIEVTATKRSESIQDVPVAVSALDGKALENLGIDNFQDYVEFLPNVVFQGTGPGQNEIYIRGAATTQSSITLSSVQALQPSVAFYLDEMPVSMAGRNLDIFATDVERVEVLPGPQGTLFGASSQAGTVRLITNKPDHSGFAAGFDTSISTTKGGDMSNTVEAYFNVTPTDNLALRVAAYNESQGGWIDNIENDPNNGGYIGSAVVIDRISGGALQAQGIDPADMDTRREINGFNRSEAAVVTPRNSEHVEDNFNDAVYSGARFGLSYIINEDWDLLVQHTEQTLDTEGVFAYDPTVEGESSAIRFQSDENSDEFGLTTWTLNGRLEKLDVVYTGGYLDREIDTLTDYTGYTNGGLFSAYYVCTHYETPDNPDDARCLDPSKYYKEDTTSTRLTHELRFSTTMDTPWQLTAGVFYDEQEVASVGQFKIASPEIFENLASSWNALAGDRGINSDGGPFSPEISFVNDVTHTIEQIAVFGQLGYEITDTVTATVGARWYQIDDIYRGATSTRDVTSRLEAYGQGVLDPAVYDGLGLDGQGVVDAIQDGSLDIGLLGDDGVLTVDDTIFKFGLDWKVNENVLLFANYSEGFRPPVTNRLGGDAAANNTGAFADFRVPVYSTTDTLDNYEIGLKGDFLDGILRVNATGYYSEISDLQTSRFDPTNISFLVFTDNVGDAEVKGIDADITWLASDNLVINAAFSVLDTELVSINSELEGISAGVGSKLPYSADFSGNISARYFFELDGGKEGFVNASLTYTGDRLAGMVMNAYAMEDATRLIYGTGSGLKIEDEGEVFNGATYPGADGETIRGGRYIQESYVIGNVSVGMSYESWKVEAFIDNVFDKSAILNIDTQQFTPKVVTNRPRTIGLRFSYDYY